MCRSGIDPNQVPPGALVAFLQRGMQYLELEANVDEEVRTMEGRGGVRKRAGAVWQLHNSLNCRAVLRSAVLPSSVRCIAAAEQGSLRELSADTDRPKSNSQTQTKTHLKTIPKNPKNKNKKSRRAPCPPTLRSSSRTTC